MGRLAALLCCVLLTSCDQFARVGVREPEEESVEPPPERDAAPPVERDAAMPGLRDASADAATDAGAQCEHPSIAVCNPVTNVGCPAALGMQCAIDRLASLTGYCIFSSTPAPTLGGECLNTGVTESCPPATTCYSAVCRTICLCDSDCGAGQCCTQPVASTGFEVCGDC